MSFALAHWFWPVAAKDTTAPKPPAPPRPPLLMGDLVAQRGDVPEFLIQWRAAKAAKDQDVG